MSEPERGSARGGTAPGRVFAALPVLGSRQAVTVTGAALAGGLLIVAWWWQEAGSGVGVSLALGMLALFAWGAARVPVDYRLTDGPVVVVHRRLFPDVPYRVTGGVEGFNDLEALRRRNQPSGTLVAGGGAWTGGTHLTGEKGTGASYHVFQRYTVQENLVRVEVAGGTLLVSPADRQAFIDAVRAATDPGHG
jgi:hypothetical protein